MHSIHWFWQMQPTSVRLFIVVLVAVFVISLIRLVRLAGHLCRPTGGPILPETVLRRAVTPDCLARSALAGRLRVEITGVSAVSADGANAEEVHCLLGSAEATFLCLWQKCRVDLEASMRACLFLVLLSLVTVGFGANPIYHSYREGSRLTGSTCLVLTLGQLVLLFAFGLSLCTALYVLSSALLRMLAMRKVNWEHFYARLTRHLPNDR